MNASSPTQFSYPSDRSYACVDAAAAEDAQTSDVKLYAAIRRCIVQYKLFIRERQIIP